MDQRLKGKAINMWSIIKEIVAILDKSISDINKISLIGFFHHSYEFYLSDNLTLIAVIG